MNDAAATPSPASRRYSKLERMRPRGDQLPYSRPNVETRPGGHDDPTGRKTRQGVRDLDGFRNGNRSASCPHFRDPQSVSTHTVPSLKVDELGFPTTIRTTHCSRCGGAMGEADE